MKLLLKSRYYMQFNDTSTQIQIQMSDVQDYMAQDSKHKPLRRNANLNIKRIEAGFHPGVS